MNPEQKPTDQDEAVVKVSTGIWRQNPLPDLPEEEEEGAGAASAAPDAWEEEMNKLNMNVGGRLS